MAGIADTATDLFSKHIYNKDDGLKAGALLPVAAVAIAGYFSGGSIWTMLLALVGGLLASPLVTKIGQSMGWIKPDAKVNRIQQVQAVEPFKNQALDIDGQGTKVTVSTPADPIPLPSNTIAESLDARTQVADKHRELTKLRATGANSEAIAQKNDELAQLKANEAANFQNIAAFTGSVRAYKNQYPALLDQRQKSIAQIAAINGAQPSALEGQVPIPPPPPEALYTPDKKLLAGYALQYDRERGVVSGQSAFASLSAFDQVAYALNKAEDKVNAARSAIDIKLLPALAGASDDNVAKMGEMAFVADGRLAPDSKNLERVPITILSYAAQNNAAIDIMARLDIDPESKITVDSKPVIARQALRDAASYGLDKIREYRTTDTDSEQQYKNVLAYCDACDERASITAEMKKLDATLDAQKSFVSGPLENYRQAQTRFISDTLPALAQTTTPAIDLAEAAKRAGVNGMGLPHSDDQHDPTGSAPAVPLVRAESKPKAPAVGTDGKISTSGSGSGASVGAAD